MFALNNFKLIKYNLNLITKINKYSSTFNKFLINDKKFFLANLNHKRLLSEANKQIIIENNNNNNNNSNDKDSNNKQQKPIEISPIRKLLRVKDYLDVVIFLFLATGIYIGYKNAKKRSQNEKKFNIEWLSLPFLKHKIFVCNGFYLPEFVAKHLEDFKQFQLRKDDVWVVSFPKSGTTWVQELVYLILNDCNFDKAKQDSIENRSPFLDYPSPGLNYINNLKSNRIIKTHLPLSFLPDGIENECKVIYITRNPKDVAVSYYHFTKLSTQAQYTGEFFNFSKLFIEGKVPYGPWWSHVDDYASKKNIHLVSYEDLHENPIEVIKSLSNFLGKELNDEQISSIQKWCSFENMKENPAVNYEWYKTLGLYKKDGHFFRKGKIGDWLNHFSRDDSIKLDQVIEENMKNKFKFNYGISDDDLKKIYSFNK